MNTYRYILEVNGGEYSHLISVEADERPVCTNEEYNHCLIINGAKVFFEEDIEDVTDKIKLRR